MEQPEQSIVVTNHGWKQVSLVTVALCSIAMVLLFNLGEARLWDRDETRNAGCAAEMFVANNWVVPIFNDQLRFQKPVLTYWVMMTSYAVFGVNEFAARFGSVVLSLGACLLTFRIGSRLFDFRTGLLAMLVLPGTIMFTVAARAATPDAPLIFFFVATMWCFVESGVIGRTSAGGKETSEVDPFPVWWTLVMYAMIAMGFLAKGLAGVIPPLAIVGLFRLLQRSDYVHTGQWRAMLSAFSPVNMAKTLLEMRFVTGLTIVAVVAGPWYWAVGQATEGEFLRLFFLREHLERATEAFEGHSAGVWFYPVAVLAGFFPWSVFAVPVLVTLWKQPCNKDSAARVFLAVWVVVEITIFTIARTKLPSYVTPCYPALAILGSHLVFSVLERQQGRLYQLSFFSLVAFAIPAMIAIGWGGHQYLDGHWEIAVIMLPLVAGGLLICCRPGMANRPWVFAASALAFSGLLFGFGATVVDSTRKHDQLFAVIQSLPDEVPVGCFRVLESGWVVYGDHSLVEFTELGETPGSLKSPRKFWQAVPRVSPENTLAESGEVYLLTDRQFIDEIRQRMGQPGEIVVSAPDFLKNRELILMHFVSQESAPMREAGIRQNSRIWFR